MRIRKLSCFGMLPVLASVLLVTSCSSAQEPSRNFTHRSGVKPIALAAPAALLATTPGEQDTEAQAVARGVNEFAFRLSAILSSNLENENLVLSPFSVWVPLAALVNATDEQHKPALLEALSASGISAADINRAASRMMYDLTDGESNESPLKIANAIFVDYNVTLRTDFAQMFMDYFRGTMMNLDFMSQAAIDAVNEWAYDNTDGMITDLVDEFDGETIAAIGNAIFFKDSWSREFDPEDTKEDIFYSPLGEQTVDFMQRNGRGQIYYEDDYVQAIHLSYVEGGGMYIILPRDGNATEMLSSMTIEGFENISQNTYLATGQLALPRFTIESSIDSLTDALITLGVPLFGPLSAPLNGLVYESFDLIFLGNSIQKAKIVVDEEGTTAAAATIFDVEVESIPDPEPTFEMIVDSPFVFVLVENTTDGGKQVLFTGVVNTFDS